VILENVIELTIVDWTVQSTGPNHSAALGYLQALIDHKSFTS